MVYVRTSAPLSVLLRHYESSIQFFYCIQTVPGVRIVGSERESVARSKNIASVDGGGQARNSFFLTFFSARQFSFSSLPTISMPGIRGFVYTWQTESFLSLALKQKELAHDLIQQEKQKQKHAYRMNKPICLSVFLYPFYIM